MLRHPGAVALADFWKVRLRYPGTAELVRLRHPGTVQLADFWKVRLRYPGIVKLTNVLES